MKRITSWPQFILGLAFSWGALLGWTAVFGEIGLPAILLYVGGVAWTIGYDTIYAHQDREDDAVIGVRSTARLFGTNTKLWIGGFYVIAILVFALAFAAADRGPAAFLGLLAGGLHMAWQIATLKIGDSDNCLARFQANRHFGWMIFAGLVADSLIGNS